MSMTEFRRSILLHSLGLEQAPAGLPCRNYFNSDEAGNDFNACMALVEMGFMRQGRTAEGPSIYFHATVEGVQAAVGLRIPMSAIKSWMKTGKWSEEFQPTEANQS